MAHLSRYELWKEEQGFTLPELLITIVLLGILLGIASSSWFGIVESRRVDSAANQLASDLRLAHTRATNQLYDWQMVLYPGRGEEDQGTDYKLVRVSDSSTVNRFLPDNSEVLDSELSGSNTLTFKSHGSVEAQGGFTDTDSDEEIRITVSVDGDPSRSVTVVPATSRVKVVP